MTVHPLSEADVRQRPWGLWATAAFAFGLWQVFQLVQIAMGQGMDELLALLRFSDDLPERIDGLVFSLVTCASALVCVPLVVAAARLRVGLAVRDYLGLGPVPARDLLRWLVVTAIIVVQLDLILYLATGELMPSYWIAIYRSAVSVPLFWLTLIFVAPLLEEVFFRGFLFEGLRRSWMGGTGAVVLTALVWVGVHGEEDPLHLAAIFVFGVVLGIARLRTGSIRTSFVMHALNNCIAGIELAWAASRSAGG